MTKDTHALEPREQRFVDEYLKDLNGAAAAVRAGYSARSAKHTAGRILGRQRVADAIAIRSKELTEKAGVTQERIIEQLARIAFQDARKFFDEKGNLKPITELDDDAAAALSGFDIEDTLVGKGDDAVTFRVKKLRRWSPLDALQMLCRVHSMFRDNVNVTGDFADKLVRARERARQTRS